MLGPRDGEVLAIVEPKPEIEVMLQPSGDGRGDDKADYDVAIYTIGRHLKPGVFQYNYVGLKSRETEREGHENPQD